MERVVQHYPRRWWSPHPRNEWMWHSGLWVFGQLDSILEIFSSSNDSMIPSPNPVLLTGPCPLPLRAGSRLLELPACSAFPPHSSPVSVMLFLAPFPSSLAAKVRLSASVLYSLSNPFLSWQKPPLSSTHTLLILSLTALHFWHSAAA